MPETATRKRSGRREASAEPPPVAEDGHGAPAIVCNVAFCPICMAVTAAQSAAPETLDHLLRAAREFFLAARAVIDARGDHLAGGGRAGAPDIIEKIEIT